jgi:hypothetical protein
VSFLPFFDDHSDLLSIVVPDQRLANRLAESEGRRALGFIQYAKKTCRVTIANACTKLPINALGMGFTTKDAHDHLVGLQGDGLKVAALRRLLGELVSIAASGCNWRFDMQHRLHFDVLYSGSISENQVDPVGRSCSRHGKPSVPRGEGCGRGDRRDAGQIRPTVRAGRVFGLAPLTTIDIRGLTYPSGIISTTHGDLILDAQLEIISITMESP